MEEAPNEVWKVRDIEMDTETFNREGEISNCTIAEWFEIKVFNTVYYRVDAYWVFVQE